MRLKLGLFSLIVCFGYTCNSQVPLRVKKNFKFCYDHTINYSQSFIKYNGYYILKHPPFNVVNYDNRGKQIDYSVDTTFSTIMFFQDGVLVCGNTETHRAYYEIDYLKKIEQQIQPETKQFYNAAYWGIYKIDGDTIKLQYISHQPWLNPYWTLIEVWYKMLDENTLKLVYAKDYMHVNKTRDESIIAIEFVRTDIILPSDTWLKSEKWFWCDEKQYKQWKESRKK